MKKMASSSKYIPPEIWAQILATFPVKTLLTYRCVCKSWCHIIDHPDFADLQLKLCPNIANNRLLLTLEGLQQRGCLLMIRHIDTLAKTTRVFKKKDTSVYSIYGSCNGLLFVCRSSGISEKEFAVWNPSIRKSLTLPICPIPASLLDDAIFMFGYAPRSKDYKVVVFGFERRLGIESSEMYVGVYTLSDRQWTLRSDGLNIGLEYIKRMFGSCRPQSTGIFFDGRVYFLGNDAYGDSDHGNKPTHLVSLDLDTEKFTFLELPYVPEKPEMLRFLFLLGESLAVFAISLKSSHIWVLGEDCGKGVWTERFSGRSIVNGFHVFSSCQLSPIFYYESDDGSCFICGAKSYNIATCQVKLLRKYMSRYFDMETYSQSLVLYNGYGAKDLSSFP